MRSHPLDTIPSSSLVAVTGGCHKGCCPQPAAQERRHAKVTVGTGQVGGQLIQQSLGGGAAPPA
ncbi:hypothetical protein BH11MYX1_BH11MYX1_56970 [soil metagenome]